SRSLRSLDSNPGIRIEPPWHVKDVPLAERRSAEGEGFEPPVPARARRFSRPVHSTALPPLRVRNQANFAGFGCFRIQSIRSPTQITHTRDTLEAPMTTFVN